MYCGKCGSEIPEGYEFCMKCGTKVDINGNSITSNEVTHKKKKLKIIIPVILILIIAVIGGGGYYYINNIVPSSGYYGNTKWGMSSEQVKKIVDSENLSSEDDTIITSIDNFDGEKDLNAIVSYSFTDDKLENVSVFFTIDENSSYINTKIVKIFQNKYNKIYGDYKEEIASYKWTTKNSEIELINFSEDVVMITFKDITTVDE